MSSSEAVSTARKAFRSGKTLPVEWRVRQLKAMQRMVEENEVISPATDFFKGAQKMTQFPTNDTMIYRLHRRRACAAPCTATCARTRRRPR